MVIRVRTIETGSAVLTVDLLPAPAAGTYSRSAFTLHDQRYISRNSLARSSGAGAGPGPGGRSGVVGEEGREGGGFWASLRLTWGFFALWWCHLGDISLRRSPGVGRGYVVLRSREFGC